MNHQNRRNGEAVLRVVQAVIGDLSQPGKALPDQERCLGDALGLEVAVADGTIAIRNQAANVFAWLDGHDYHEEALRTVVKETVMQVRDGKAEAVIDVDVALEDISGDCAMLSSVAMQCSFPVGVRASAPVIASLCREAADLWLAEGEATTVRVNLIVTAATPRLH